MKLNRYTENCAGFGTTTPAPCFTVLLHETENEYLGIIRHVDIGRKFVLTSDNVIVDVIPIKGSLDIDHD